MIDKEKLMHEIAGKAVAGEYAIEDLLAIASCYLSSARLALVGSLDMEEEHPTVLIIDGLTRSTLAVDAMLRYNFDEDPDAPENGYETFLELRSPTN